MALLILGLLAFLGLHLVPAFPGIRNKLAGRLGENAYKGLFTVFAIAALALLVWGFSRAPFIEVWSPPVWTRHLALLLMLFASIALVAAYSPGRIKQALKHPMLVAVKIWALAHLLANGDLASMILFASFLAYAVFDRIMAKRRGDTPRPLPEAANRNDAIAVILGLALYGAIVFWLHEVVIGVPVIA